MSKIKVNHFNTRLRLQSPFYSFQNKKISKTEAILNLDKFLKGLNNETNKSK